MAAVTEHLGFGITAGTAFEHPYPFARRLSTPRPPDERANRVERGHRIPPSRPHGTWARTTNSSTTIATTTRTSTSKFSTSCGKRRGKTTRWCVTEPPGSTQTPAKVHPIEHEGKHFTVPGIHISEPSPQADAGHLPGRRVASWGAVRRRECRSNFLSVHRQKAILKDTVARIRNELTKVGRDPYSAPHLHTVDDHHRPNP